MLLMLLEVNIKEKNWQLQMCDVVFNFHPVKIITTAEGGIATTNNEKIATKMRMIGLC